MAVMQHFTSHARKDGRWWVVQCEQHPGALSQVARLDQAVEHQREAIAFVAEMDETDVEVEVYARLTPEVQAEIDRARQLRDEATGLQVESGQLWRKAARDLRAEGYTVRDVGAALDVSYQRAHQLVSD